MFTFVLNTAADFMVKTELFFIVALLKKRYLLWLWVSTEQVKRRAILADWNTVFCPKTIGRWPFGANQQEAGNWFVKAPLLACWNEMTNAVLRQSSVEGGMRVKKRWCMTHRKINITWWGCGNGTAVLCSHSARNQPLFPRCTCDVIRENISQWHRPFVFTGHVFFCSTYRK